MVASDNKTTPFHILEGHSQIVLNDSVYNLHVNTDAILHIPRLPFTAETQVPDQPVWKPCFSTIIDR